MTTPADFARGNAQLAEVQEAAEQLFDNLMYLSSLTSHPLRLVDGQAGYEYGGAYFVFRLPEAPFAEVRLQKKYEPGREQLILEIRPFRSDLPNGLEYTWENGKFAGVMDRVEMESAESNYDVLEIGLAALLRLNSHFAADLLEKTLFRAGLLMNALAYNPSFIDEPDTVGRAINADGSRTFRYELGEDGLELVWHKGQVNLLAVEREMKTFVYDTAMPDRVEERSDPVALAWANSTIQELLRNLIFR